MNSGLVRKEMRGQWPFLFLGLALLLISIGELIWQRWDLEPLGNTFPELGPLFPIQFFIAFAVGSGLLMREIDDGTLAFLDGLPLTRTRTFVAKVLTASVVLMIYPLGYLVLLVILHLAARGSLDHELHVPLLATEFSLMVLLTLVGLTCGLLLGYLRALAWLVLALLAIGIEALSREWPRFSALNPVDTLVLKPVGAHLPLPVEGISVQAIAVLLFGLSAFWLFNLAGAGRRRSLQMYLSRPMISAMVMVVTIAALTGALFLYTKSDGEQTAAQAVRNSPNVVQFTPTAPGHAQTSHYTFSYPAQRSESVQRLLPRADQIFNDVARQLGIDGGAAIDVDLSGSIENTEGTAYPNRIRMALGGKPAAVLAHETTHVFATRLAGGEDARELFKFVVFNEGLAHWVEQRLMSSTGLSETDRLQAAIVSQRHLVSAEQLTDLDTMAREVDQNLKYPLGAVLVDVLISRYGVDSPKKLLQTMARADFPRDLYGVGLWQAAFQLSGFDLSLVFNDYARRLKSWEVEFAGSIAELPRPRGSLVRNGDVVGVKVRLDSPPPEGWQAVVRFRPREDSPLEDYLMQPAYDGTAWEPVRSAADDQVCFQPGLRSHDIVLYEAWTCLPLSSI